MTIGRARMRIVTMFEAACWISLWCAAAEAQAPAQVKLERKFAEGQTLRYKATSNARQVLSLMGMEIESVKRETKVFSRTAGKRAPDGKLPLDEKVESLRVEYSLPGSIHLNFDSSRPDPKVDNGRLAFLADVFKFDSQIAYSIVLDKENAVCSIEGIEALKEKAQKLADPTARQEALATIAADKLKASFAQGVRGLPEGPVKPGQTWERAEVLDVNGQSFQVRRKYEYTGTTERGGKTLERINSKMLEVKYDQDPNSKSSLKVTKSTLKVDSSDGTILFDREQGHVVSAREKVRIKGDMTYAGAGAEQRGAFDLSVDTTAEVQPAKR